MRQSIISTVSLVLISIFLPAISHCQNSANFEEYLEGLICSNSTTETAPLKYVMVTEYMDYDIYGNFIKKTRVSGECTPLRNVINRISMNNDFCNWY